MQDLLLCLFVHIVGALRTHSPSAAGQDGHLRRCRQKVVAVLQIKVQRSVLVLVDDELVDDVLSRRVRYDHFNVVCSVTVNTLDDALSALVEDTRCVVVAEVDGVTSFELDAHAWWAWWAW